MDRQKAVKRATLKRNWSGKKSVLVNSCQPPAAKRSKEHKLYNSFAVNPSGTTLRLQKALAEVSRVPQDVIHYFTH